MCNGLLHDMVWSQISKNYYISAKQMPFRINFTSDGFEWTDEAKNPAAPNQSDKGFKLSYYQVGC